MRKGIRYYDTDGGLPADTLLHGLGGLLALLLVASEDFVHNRIALDKLYRVGHCCMEGVGYLLGELDQDLQGMDAIASGQHSIKEVVSQEVNLYQG